MQKCQQKKGNIPDSEPSSLETEDSNNSEINISRKRRNPEDQVQVQLQQNLN